MPDEKIISHKDPRVKRMMELGAEIGFLRGEIMYKEERLKTCTDEMERLNEELKIVT